MNIVRRKKGYTVRLTDSEFAALQLLTRHGAGAADKKSPLQQELPTGMARAAIRSERFTQAGGPLATIDRDDRTEADAAC